MHIRKLGLSFSDADNCQKALEGKAHLDPEVLSYPSTSILIAEDGKETVFAPVQTCYVIDTLGYEEGTSDIGLAKAMKELTTVLVWEARKNGIGEILFLGTDERTNAFALNNGYEVLTYRVYRLRSSDPNRTRNEGEDAGLSAADD